VNLWKDLEKTIPAKDGDFVAVVEGAATVFGSAQDLISPNVSQRPRYIGGALEFDGSLDGRDEMRKARQ
jgi:hypothetical protein